MQLHLFRYRERIAPHAAVAEKEVEVGRRPFSDSKVCDAGITSTTGFIFGFPQERHADIAETMRLMLDISYCGKKDSLKHLSGSVPFAGSPLFEEFGRRLGMDEHLSNFAVSSATLVDVEFAQRYPEVFSTLYHFESEHVDRDTFVRIAHLMVNLVCLRYTAFALAKNAGFGFPESFLERITELPLPPGNIFHYARHRDSLVSVADFIAETVNRLGFKDHYIHDLIKFDLAFNSPELEANNGCSAITLNVLPMMSWRSSRRSNPMAFSGCRPRSGRRACSVIFRKISDDLIDCVAAGHVPSKREHFSFRNCGPCGNQAETLQPVTWK